jgi:hypothetical protein
MKSSRSIRDTLPCSATVATATFDLNGVNSYSAIQFSGGIYTMLRDVNATNLTVRAGQTLILGGPGSLYRLYGTGALVVENGGQVIITQQAVSAGPTAGSAPGGNSPAGSSSTTVGPAGKGANGNNWQQDRPGHSVDDRSRAVTVARVASARAAALARAGTATPPVVAIAHGRIIRPDDGIHPSARTAAARRSSPRYPRRRGRR